MATMTPGQLSLAGDTITIEAARARTWQMTCPECGQVVKVDGLTIKRHTRNWGLPSSPYFMGCGVEGPLDVWATARLHLIESL